MKRSFLSFAVFVLSVLAFGQPPQKLSYQCVVRNSGGALITNQSVGIQISILQGTPTGSVIYMESYSPDPQTNANGLLTIEIGGGVPLTGTFSSIDWAAGPYFLKTETDPSGGTNYTISGTSQLLSVPYALYSTTAGNGFSGSYTDLTNKPELFDGSWAGITGKPATIGGYGINDAVTITGNQTISGIKTFSSDLSVNIVTVGQGDGIKTWNTAFGFQTLYSNTTGINNTANGFMALKYNIIGSNNTANGSGALSSNTIGRDNTANGSGSLYYNTTGIYNSANGSGALYSNTTGSNNTANGYRALYSNTAGIYNTANGYNSLYSNTAGNYNTANGYNSLYSNTTGYRNTANGYYAFYSNTYGYDNTANGSFSLYSKTTGALNTAIGTDALYYNSAGSENVALGADAGNPGISVNFNQCTFLGSHSTLSTARRNVTMVGYGIGDSQCTGSNQVLLGNTAVSQIRAPVGSITTYSDARFKTNIKDNVEGLEFIMKLKPVTFNKKPSELYNIWGQTDSLDKKSDYSEAEKLRYIGFLAQDVEKAARESGFDFPGIDVPQNDKEVYTLRYNDFIMPLVKGMQEQQQIIENQQNEIIELKSLVNKLINNQTVKGSNSDL